jgi:hypothetical protein
MVEKNFSKALRDMRPILASYGMVTTGWKDYSKFQPKRSRGDPNQWHLGRKCVGYARCDEDLAGFDINRLEHLTRWLLGHVLHTTCCI